MKRGAVNRGDWLERIGRSDRARRCAFCLVDLAAVARPVETALAGVRYCSRTCADGADEYHRQLDAARTAARVIH